MTYIRTAIATGLLKIAAVLPKIAGWVQPNAGPISEDPK